MIAVNIDGLLEQLARTRPPVVYLAGKTSTGKSTTGRRVSAELDYEPIHLDDIVVSAVVKPLTLPDRSGVFNEIYRGRERRDWIGRFVDATSALVSGVRDNGRSVVIDGAVAHPQTLVELAAAWGDFTFAYLHPANLGNYVRNLTSRFVSSGPDCQAGLPSRFWAMVDPQEFATYCNTWELSGSLRRSIHDYAMASQAESQTRLATFRQHFNAITVVDI